MRRLIGQVLLGLEYVHGRDLVHRDGHRYVLRKIEPLAKLAEL